MTVVGIRNAANATKASSSGSQAMQTASDAAEGIDNKPHSHLCLHRINARLALGDLSADPIHLPLVALLGAAAASGHQLLLVLDAAVDFSEKQNNITRSVVERKTFGRSPFVGCM